MSRKMNSGKQTNECAEFKFQIIFIHNGKQYDKKYLQSKYFPEILTKTICIVNFIKLKMQVKLLV